MKSRRRGFTLIEVSIFLAVTGALFAAVIVGVSNSIFQQRYNDATQSFVEFLRTTYAGVKNVQNNTEEGKSERVIYGKLLVFGETKNLAGEDNGNNSIFVYSVVGKDGEFSGDNLTTYLKNQEVAFADVKEEAVGSVATFLGMTDSFTPKWSSRIEKVDYNSVDETHDLFQGALLIVRHPQTGTIYTLVYEGNEGNEGNAFKELNNYYYSEPSRIMTMLSGALDQFRPEEVNFCINPNVESPKGISRRNVRIIKNARNSSGVEIDATENNICMD